MSVDLLDFFSNPPASRQRQYEAIRAIVVEQLPIEAAAAKFGYKSSTLSNLMSRARNGKIDLFPPPKPGPKQRHTSLAVQQQVISLRKQERSAADIADELTAQGLALSASTVERILKEAGFTRLHRRTHQQRGITRKGQLIGQRSEQLDLERLQPFSVDCPVAGLYFFLPYILEMGLPELIASAHLPQSKAIGALEANLAMLAVKLIGQQRLRHIQNYDHEPGLGLFAGLNVLPKATYMGTYSCLCSQDMLMDFQSQALKRFTDRYPDFYESPYINLDFHSIPHYGEQSEMEKIWCGAKGKALKGANTIFAQDSQSNAILYTRADILRKEQAGEILRFVHYWKNIQGPVKQTLVFDCTFTTYQTLDQLADQDIRFITLRKRNERLLTQTLAIPDGQWTSIQLPFPKRKHKRVSVFENTARLPNCKNAFRQIIIKDHGRIMPTFIITNDPALIMAKIIEVYAKRWHVESKLAELVAFFNLNALSSPLMIRIHFDILWTLIADTLYHRFAQDLRRFEKLLAPSIFIKFVNMPGKIVYDGNSFFVKIRKRAHTPILKSVPKLQQPCSIPWLDNRSVQIIWTP